MMIFITARTKNHLLPRVQDPDFIPLPCGVARNCAAALMTSVARPALAAVYTFIRVNSRLVRPLVRRVRRQSSYHATTTTRDLEWAQTQGAQVSQVRCSQAATKRLLNEQRGIGHILNEISLFSGAAHYGRCKM